MKNNIIKEELPIRFSNWNCCEFCNKFYSKLELAGDPVKTCKEDEKIVMYFRPICKSCLDKKKKKEAKAALENFKKDEGTN